MKTKIDFIITWVDGNDLEWQKEKNKYLNNPHVDSKNIRYRDWENLKYLFRGIEKYAPWVNQIFFVTCGQTPEWLNTDNPKLKLINHKDYMPKKYLPTFSSHPIELNFHRIKELNEQFVYFNDDTFLTNYVTPEDFFKAGKPCEIANINPISPNEKDVVNYVFFNNTSIINKNFNKNDCIKKNIFKWINLKYGTNILRTLMSMPWNNFLGYKASHLPTSLLKSTYIDVWDKEYEKLNNTSMNKFRSKEDVSQYLLIQWQLATGNFAPRNKNFGKFYNIALNSDLYKDIEKNKYKVICINDNDLVEDFDLLKAKINSSFDKILPDKSTFEK